MFQHSMVYFFHHYELPAIIQQAHVQHFLNRNGPGSVPGRGVPPNQANHVPPANEGSGGAESQTGTAPADNLPNGRVTAPVETEGQNILHNHIDQGLLNEIFEDVDDVQVDGYNIDQQLLMNLEDEILEIQNTHGQTVAESNRHSDTANTQVAETSDQVVPGPSLESTSTSENNSANSGAVNDCTSHSDTNNVSVSCLSEELSTDCPSQSKQSKDLASDSQCSDLQCESAIADTSGCVRFRGTSDPAKNTDGTEV